MEFSKKAVIRRGLARLLLIIISQNRCVFNEVYMKIMAKVLLQTLYNDIIRIFCV